MGSRELIARLRKTDDSPEISGLLSTLGVTKKPKMPRGDIEARVDLPKKGLCLIFKPEGAKSSKLLLVAVQFYSDAEKGYTSYQGELPGDLLLSDTQVEVRKKLGKPTESKKEFRLDRWKSEGLVTTVEYSKQDGRIAVLSLHLPEFY